jgi:hypothetical protein
MTKKEYFYIYIIVKRKADKKTFHFVNIINASKNTEEKEGRKPNVINNFEKAFKDDMHQNQMVQMLKDDKRGIYKTNEGMKRLSKEKIKKPIKKYIGQYA